MSWENPGNFLKIHMKLELNIFGMISIPPKAIFTVIYCPGKS